MWLYVLVTGADYDVDSGALFIQDMFLYHTRSAGRVIYPHFTTATDTTNIQVVFKVIMDTIVKENLAAAQLLWQSSPMLCLLSSQNKTVVKL